MADYDYSHYDAIVPSDKTPSLEEAALMARILDLEQRVEALEDLIWRGGE